MTKPLVSLPTSGWGTATHVTDAAGTWRPILDVTPLAGDSPYFPPPPPTATRDLGVYSAAGAGNDSQSLTYFGRYPDAASDYYQVSGIGNIVANQTPRIMRGVKPVITLSLRSLTRPHEALAAGPSDANYAAAWSAITAFADALKTLSEVDPNIVVRGLVESEIDVKMVQKTLTCTATQAGQSLDVCNARIKERAPKVRTGLWFGGTQKTMIRTIMDQITPGNIDDIGADPYLNGTGTGDHSGPGALANTWLSKWLTWLRTETNYTRLGKPRCLITEFGMSVTTQPHTDAEIAAYYADIRGAMDACDVDVAILFDDPKDKDHEITDGNHPLAVTSFTGSLAA